MEKEKIINEKAKEIEQKQKEIDEERINKFKKQMFERQKKMRNKKEKSKFKRKYKRDSEDEEEESNSSEDENKNKIEIKCEKEKEKDEDKKDEKKGEKEEYQEEKENESKEEEESESKEEEKESELEEKGKNESKEEEENKGENKKKKEELGDNRKEKEIKNKEINEVLEDMCIYGNIIKKEIEEEKDNKEKYIDKNEALQSKEKDKGLFALGLLSNELESLGIKTVIERNGKDFCQNEEEEEEEGDEEEEERVKKKEKDKNDDNNNASATCLQFIINGLSKRKKYNLHFDFGEERNEDLLNNEEEYEKFKTKLKLKLSKDYNISVDKIIVTFPQRGSFEVQVIFQSDDFNNLDLEAFKSKFQNEKDKDFLELKNLKEIHSDVLMGACKLTKKMLDPRGNRSDGWGVGEMRGNKPYDPPIGWIGIGLKVMDEYDDGDNTWIGMDNIEGEWCVAYHGVGRDNESEKVKNITGLIIKGEKQKFKPGYHQAHRNCKDQFHEGNLVGEGVYCTPTISTADEYSGISEINGKQYKTVLMVRVKPDAIRGCKDSGDYWVVNGTTDEIRPYRILYRETDEDDEF